MDKQHPNIPVSNASAHTRPLHKNAVILGGEPEEWEIQARDDKRAGSGPKTAPRHVNAPGGSIQFTVSLQHGGGNH